MAVSLFSPCVTSSSSSRHVRRKGRASLSLASLSPRTILHSRWRLLFFFACICLLTLGLLLISAACSLLWHDQLPLPAVFSRRSVILSGESDAHSRNARFLDETGAPHPLFVIAGGAPRTGSTLIFNALRILMRIRDPNTVASSNWMLAKLVPENRTLEQYDRIKLLRTLGTSLLVKVHTANQYYQFAGPLHEKKFADEVDLLVTGYRDLREETVSALKMFVRNRTEWETQGRWTEMCRALIRRRDSLIKEASGRVPIVDVRYEEWRDAGEQGMWALVKRLAEQLPWAYTDEELRRTVSEVRKMRVPRGGEIGERVEWHVANLMSPKHISVEHLSEDLIDMGVNAVGNEPTCAQWLVEKRYV